MSTTIFAYGFDRIGFDLCSDVVSIPDIGEVIFVGFEENVKLDKASGVIIPSGIFEYIEEYSAYSMKRGRVRSHNDLLVERQRELRNMMQNDCWVCFLIDRLLDRIPNYDHVDLRYSDLCKRFLNDLQIGWQGIPDIIYEKSFFNEFTPYLKDYGVAKTAFSPPDTSKFRILATVHNTCPIGIENERKLFFLPFHTTRKDTLNSKTLVQVIVSAIVKYRQNCKEEAPKWASELKFEEERELEDKHVALTKDIENILPKIKSWQIVKSILVTSGDILKDRVISILKDYFGLNINPLDEHKEDAKV